MIRILALALLLAGCATAPPPRQETMTPERQQNVAHNTRAINTIVVVIISALLR